MISRHPHCVPEEHRLEHNISSVWKTYFFDVEDPIETLHGLSVPPQINITNNNSQGMTQIESRN
jgi:hypothetical protein